MDFMSTGPVAERSPAAHAGDPDRGDNPGEPINEDLNREVIKHWFASGEPRPIRISGNSMLPFLRDGDTVLVKPSGGNIIHGDIVIYFMGEVLLIHRAVKIARDPGGRVLRTKGDFAVSLDPGTVRETDLIGKAVAVRRGKTHMDLQSAPLRALGSVAALLSYAIGITLGRLRRASGRSGGFDWRHLLILAAISFAIYANSIPGSFVVDDYERWRSTTWIEGRPLGSVLWEFFNPARAQLYRPVPYTLHAIDYRLWGTNASGFHVTNIVLHALVACLVYLVGLSLLKKRAPAFIVALLFAMHPVHTEAVTYIAGRTDLTMTLFALLSFLLFLKARRPSGRRGHLLYTGSLGAFALALMSKEAAVALPLILILHYLCFRPQSGRRTWRGLVMPVAPYVILVIVYLGMRFTVPGRTEVEVQGPGLWVQILTALRAFNDYLEALVLPLNLALRLDFSWSESFSEPGTLFPLIASTGFLILTVWAFRAARNLSFGLAWIALCLLPVSNVLAVTEKPLFAERFLYLPSVGFCFALGYLIYRLVPTPSLKPIGKRAALTGPVVVTCIALAYLLLTVERNRDWISPIALSRKTLQQNPESASARMLAHCNRGTACEEQGDYTGAIAEYKRAIELDIRAFAAYRRLAALYLDIGMVNESIAVCQQALAVNPRQVEIHVRLGNAYLRRGMLDEAIIHYSEAINLNPRITEPYINMGAAYLRKGAPDEAIAIYRMALKLAPGFSQAHANLGNAYMAKGDVDRAIGEYKTALSLDPDFVEVHINLSRAYRTGGMLGEAIAECEKALARKPDLVEAHINLAALHYHNGDYKAAIHHCDKVTELGDSVDPRLLESLRPYR